MFARAILDHQIAAFSVGSADEVLKDFADGAVLITPDGVSKGREAIHAAYSAMFAELFKSGTYNFTLDAAHIDGDIAYIAWRASCATLEVPMGTGTFVVRNGKIVAQTFAAKIDPK
ncbi:MAG TPA: nuclear transport factor 2 family protein [Chloroflexota bacterium]|nr:nuclear transport factor 2 family protein [Chloroflexota bacterium]